MRMSKDIYKKKLNTIIQTLIADGADPDHIFLALTELSLEYLEKVQAEKQAGAEARG